MIGRGLQFCTSQCLAPARVGAVQSRGSNRGPHALHTHVAHGIRGTVCLLGFGLWAYLPESEEGLKGPRSAALGKFGSGAPHSPHGHAAGGRGTRLLL